MLFICADRAQNVGFEFGAVFVPVFVKMSFFGNFFCFWYWFVVKTNRYNYYSMFCGFLSNVIYSLFC